MTPGRVRRRKPFAPIRKGIAQHVLSGRLRAARFGVYMWLHVLADHGTGTVWTNATKIGTELGYDSAVVRRELEALRREGYLRYAGMRGSRQLYEITIEKFHEHYEDAHDVVHEPLHDRNVSSRDERPNRAPKNREVRSRSTSSLQHFSTRGAKPARGGAANHAAASPTTPYPTGLTRLW